MLINRCLSMAAQPLAVAFGLGFFAGSAQAIVLIDDFTATESPNPYPIVAPATSPSTFQITSDVFGPIAGVPGFRVVNFAPILSTEQVLSGVFDGSQTVTIDTGTGRLTSTSVGDGAPLLQLAWSSEAVTGLDLDLTSEAGLLFRYETNLAVNAVVSLLQLDDTTTNASDNTAGNADTVTLLPGVNTLFIPFADFDEVVSESRIVSGPPFTEVVQLDPIGLDEVDSVTLLISPIADPTVPEGLVISFDQVAFVPEPTSFALIAMGGLLLARRRR